MKALRQIIPSANGLVVFEAAGRLGSFTRAGAELGMTQAAVSQAVRGLEQHLGVNLFTRGHRTVSLTEAGARFHADVALGLGHIRKSAEELHTLGHDRHVTLSASTAFVSYWMLPRLARFREDLPHVDLRFQTSERDIDLVAENIPLGIRTAYSGAFETYESHKLAEERIIAIAGTAYVERFGLPETAEALTRHRLIHLEEPYRPCPDWAEWLGKLGLSRPPLASGLLINDYVLVVQAVIQGQGIALGWRHLVDPLIDAGIVQQVTEHELRTPTPFDIVWPRGATLSAAASEVRDWLIANAES